jgi:hypothetical protein
LALALVRDMRELREPSGAEEIEAFETDVLAGFVLARASAGLAGDLAQAARIDAQADACRQPSACGHWSARRTGHSAKPSPGSVFTRQRHSFYHGD